MKIVLTNKRRLLKLLVVFLLTLMLLEVVASIINRDFWVLKTTSNLSSTAWRLRWLATKSQQQTTNSGIDEFHPLLGWAPLRGATNIQSGDATVNFTVNGIRGKKYYNHERNEHAKRIVGLGDSFTFGQDVNDDETYLAQLENFMPNTEILNLGVHGYGIDQMTLRLELEGLSYNPDVVLYAFIDDDLDRIIPTFRDYLKPIYRRANESIQLMNTPLVPQEVFLKQMQYRPALLDLALLLQDRILYNNSTHKEIIPLSLAIWKHTVNITKNHNAIPVFLYLPTFANFTNTHSSTRHVEQLMFSFCRESQISCLSAVPYLEDAYAKGLQLGSSNHYAPTTNTILAKRLAIDLQKIIALHTLKNPNESGF